MFRKILRILSYKVFSKILDDKSYLKILFYACMGKKLDLKNPKTFNEKLQWLKLYDRNPEYIKMVDKYEAKKYVAEKIGEEYIIPTIGIWDSVEEIDFDALPEQFVLKSTHDSGMVVICRDKSQFDIEEAKKTLKKSFTRDYYKSGREWVYKNVKRRIIAEKFMVDESGKGLNDYKFFCFDGEPKGLFVATDRPYDTRFDFYDLEFNHLPIINGHPNADKVIEKPKGFHKMIELAKTLSADIPHVRVDFYDINGRVYFGELTFYHYSGFVPFEPQEWDLKFGNFITLP